jgi:hypothetical protein
MARISTGQNVGTTDRGTSQRLVGGAPMEATQGALAQRDINAPALQPTAAPVNTFQQTGAPTLGGPIRLFAPPELPQPNQDLAALAKSLGSFSSTLEQVGKTALEVQKAQSEQAKKQGQAIAIQLAAKYPGQQFAEVRDAIAKKAQAGDATAQADYQLLQSKNPLVTRYAQSYLEEQVALNDLTTAPGRWRSMQEIPGVATDANGNPTALPKEILQPGDPRLQQAMMKLVRLPSDPEAAARVLPQINALYRELTTQQTNENADWKKRYFISVVGDYTASVVNSSTPDAEAAARISGMLLDARRVLGPKEYGDVVQAVNSRLESGAQSASYQTDGSINTEKGSAAVSRAIRLQEMIVAGANGETLLNRLGSQGGLTGQLNLLKSGLEGIKSAKGLTDDFSRFRGEKLGPQISAKFDILNPELVGPARERNVAAARLEVTRIADPVARQEASNQLERDISAMQKGVVEYRESVLQRQVYALMQSALDPQKKLDQLYQLAQSGEVDPAFINAQIDRAERERAQLNRPSQNAIDNRLKDIMKQETDFLGQAGPVTGQGISQEESSKLNNKKANIQFNLNEIRRQGYAAGKSNEQITKEQNQYLDSVVQEFETRRKRAAPLQVRPAIPNPEQYYNERGGFLGMGRNGRSRIAGQLNKAVDNGIVMPKNKYDEALEAWVTKNTLPPWARQIIRDAGYGQKADEFFRKQWNNLNPGAPFPAEYEPRMDALKGVKVSYTPPAGGTGGLAMINPTAATTTRLASFASNMLNTVFTPPAAAGTLDAQVANLSGKGFNGLLATIRSGEGGWTSVNRGRTGDSGPMRNLTSQSIGAIENMQNRGRVFAVGAYQFTPGVLARARREAGLSPNAPFTPENQNKMAMALILGSKRPALASYIRGQNNNLRAAHEDIALEWAALQGPNGRGMYDNDKAGNMASIPAARVRAALQEARRAYLANRRS